MRQDMQETLDNRGSTRLLYVIGVNLTREKLLRLSVIIPSYNEAGRIGPTVERVGRCLADLRLSYEIVVVDDGSTDGTGDAVREAAGGVPGLRLVGLGVNRGKGYAVREGFMRSGGEFVLLSDADLSTPIGELERFLPEMERGADIVIGSRSAGGARIIRRQPLYRMLMGKAFNKVVWLLAVRGLSDTQCGFKLFRRKTCEDLFRMQRVERFAFDAELLFLARKRGLAIRELPVRWTDSPGSKVRIFRDSSRMLLDVIRVRLGYVAGKYPGF